MPFMAGDDQSNPLTVFESVAKGRLRLELAGGVDAGKALMDALELWALAENLGSAESLVTHPVTMTHADVDEAERERVGITEGLVRLSVGLEHVDDLIDDLTTALDKV